MPIRPENRKRYPKDWREISLRIRYERAGGRCECTGQCGVDHAVYDGFAGPNVPITQTAADLSSGRCIARNGKKHPVTGSNVVLTVAHLDHQPENCDDTNLKAMCQRCHNRYDAPMRRRGIQERQRAKAAVCDLFQTDTEDGKS